MNNSGQIGKQNIDLCTGMEFRIRKVLQYLKESISANFSLTE